MRRAALRRLVRQNRLDAMAVQDAVEIELDLVTNFVVEQCLGDR
jgi:hypothetical protein